MSVELLEKFDNFSPLRNRIRKEAEKIGEWAGVPLPLDGTPLVVEPSYPFAEIFNAREPEEPDPEGWRARNRFLDPRGRGEVVVMENAAGKITYGIHRGLHGFDEQLQTLGASFAWGLEQEGQALKTLAHLIRAHAFKQYLLTGMFLETSERSGVMYVFRKLRPTVALRENKILACLCLHPIAYYEGSWAGAMCPTDDVLAHLMLMRGDEHMFWKRSNQHPPWVPQAGL